jgi:excisionase family DNA binding protein
MSASETREEQELLSLSEAAEFLFVSKSTLYRLLGEGKLHGMKAGKQWRFRREDLLDYIERGPAALALANLPMAVLEAELDFLAEELVRAGTSAEASDDPSLTGEEGKLGQFVRRVVWLLHARGGSDIFLEPVWEAGREYTRLRLRVDGRLEDVRELPFALHEPLILEWRARAGLSLESRTRPADGSARLTFGETLVPLRVSIVPTLYGERLAVRDIPTRVPTLEELGLGESPLQEWLRRPRGLLLIAGPTGSGKATTRAACVHEMLTRNVNILAVEDTVQYLFPPRVAQLKVEGFTCAEGVRAVMQQDPDVIVLGDVAGDQELARAAMYATETGHLVLPCLHADDSLDPLYDLLESGIKRSQLVANLIGVVYQQLFEKLCPACMVAYAPAPELLEQIRTAAAAGGYVVPDSADFHEAVGCEACGNRGTTGRIALHEYFSFTPALKDAFLRGASAEELGRLARREGLLSLFATAVQRAVAGWVPLEEVMRRVPQWTG